MRALLVAVLLACAPTQHDAPRYGVVRIHFPPGNWASNFTDQFRLAMQDAAALGPDFAVTTDASQATVIVEHFDSGPGCRDGAGRWLTGTNRVQLDPVCLPGLLFQRAAFLHEVGHALGMRHVCRQTGQTADCSPIGLGVAVMNPSLSYGDTGGPTFDTAYTGPTPQWFPTQLDLDEFRRTRP